MLQMQLSDKLSVQCLISSLTCMCREIQKVIERTRQWGAANEDVVQINDE